MLKWLHLNTETFDNWCFLPERGVTFLRNEIELSNFLGPKSRSNLLT